MGRREKYRVFRPRRRAFLGRRKALLPAGTWAFGLAGVAFGAVVSAHWPSPASPAAALVSPPAAEAILVAEAPKPVEVVRPTKASAAPPPVPAPPVAAVLPPPADEPTLHVHAGAVRKVVDGNTFYLEGVRTRVRLWGVDAPEANEAGGAAATAALQSLVAGRRLACEEMDRDRHARIVARCRLDDGSDLARLLLDLGLATEMTRFSGGYYGG
ncbi:MAG: thermonuclease family protein [Parvularculaceae bacterium]